MSKTQSTSRLHLNTDYNKTYRVKFNNSDIKQNLQLNEFKIAKEREYN